MKLKTKQNPLARKIKIVFRVNASELHEILKKSDAYVPGDDRRKLSKWCRHAAINHVPKKTDLEK